MSSAGKAIEKLSKKLYEKEHPVLSFEEFVDKVSENPSPVFRNTFHLFYDFIHHYIKEGIQEYPDDPENINYVKYDADKLLVEGADNPFFADRLFANKLMKVIASFKRGMPQNKIYLFEGPHGSGKSTFLNNMLAKFEEYTDGPEGMTYEIVWRLDKKRLGENPGKRELEGLLLHEYEAAKLGGCKHKEETENNGNGHNGNKLLVSGFLEVPCPSHDHPLLMIPKEYRKEFLEDIIKDKKFKEQLFTVKEYEWIFKRNPCTICTSLYQAVLERLGSPEEVFKMIFAKKYNFNKRLGEGIGVFNAGDSVHPNNVLTNEVIHQQLGKLFGDSNKIQYLFSRFAKTNNGIYALMDIKNHNVERLKRLHGIISEGVHKVDDLEESVNSLFIAVINPEDKTELESDKMKAFSDRLHYIRLPYVRDYNTEVEIYKSVFGKQIDQKFLPRVLRNFAKAVVASRLGRRSQTISEWISNPFAYSKYCDESMLLLKMDIYTGLIPQWLSEEHKKRFTARLRKKLILEESEQEGFEGFSGREAIAMFSEFYSTFSKKTDLINMADVMTFFSKENISRKIPADFLRSLKDLYDYTTLQEIKEALYYYNEKKISSDIQNYLFAINFDGEKSNKVKCVYTGEMLEINDDFFKNLELRILGTTASYQSRQSFREYTQKEYASKTLTQEMQVEGKKLTETELYNNLFTKYTYNLKENVLDPVKENDNFRNAIKSYGTKDFDTYDKRIKEDVVYLMKNLVKKFGYTEEGARQVCIYVIDNHIIRRF
ncbi:serine protein kinase PrkA [Candidatus Woesearchaeota archaeon]|nr:serine protein kinase PrkA [Candidatus Woesearchaeota archaeon]